MDPDSRRKNWLILIVVLLTAALLCGCQTVWDQYEYSGFVWQERSVLADYREVHRRMVHGFTVCPKVGMAESLTYEGLEFEAIRMEIYERDLFMNRTEFQLGIIELREAGPDLTLLRIGVRSDFDMAANGEPGYYTKQWMNFAAGNYSCEP